MKRQLILTLIFVFLFSLIPLNVFAEDYEIKVNEVIWIDDDASKRPDGIIAQLSNIKAGYSSYFILTEDNNFSGIKKYSRELINDPNSDFELKVMYSPSYSCEVSGNARDGFVITATYVPQETTIKLTKNLEGYSKEDEFGVYLLPIKRNYYYSPKVERRYPTGFGIVTIKNVKIFLDILKEYDKTSGKYPLHPLYSRLFDEDGFLKENIEQLNNTEITEGDSQVFTEEELDFLWSRVIPYFWGYQSIDDIGIGKILNNVDWDEHTPEMAKYYERYLKRGYSYMCSEEGLAESGYKSYDEYLSDQAFENRVFYTTIKAGETKEIKIPAADIVSLAVVEADYEDTEEPDIIYYNKMVTSMYRSAAGYNVWNAEGKNYFEYTLTNKGQPLPELSTTVSIDNNKASADNALEIKLPNNDTKDITDIVCYSNLIKDATYELKGTLVEVKNGEVVKENTTATETKIAENSGGIWETTFKDVPLEIGKTYVVFEQATMIKDANGNEIPIEERITIEHANPNDKAQTIVVSKKETPKEEITEEPKEKEASKIKISTYLERLGGGKTIEIGKNIMLVDTISYEGLEAGQEYEFSGILMDKSTGKPVLVNGEKVIGGTIFTPDKGEEKGKVKVDFDIDTTKLADKELVAFEEVKAIEKEDDNGYYGKVVAEHKDINDEAQTVQVKGVSSVPKTLKVNTGDTNNIVLYVGILCVCVLALGVLIHKKKKK